MTSAGTADWICCQLGAREHFAVPRALKRLGALHALVTEAWVPPASPLRLLSRGLRGRWHPDLRGASVTSWNLATVGFEATLGARKLGGWEAVVARNRWFQSRATRALAARSARLESAARGATPVLFAYSYAALEPFRFAKRRGWTTILGQIDPGPAEERLVARLFGERGGLVSAWRPAPADYWRDWREECALADRIVVNSEWSQEGIEQEIGGGRLCVVPLAYEAPVESRGFKRSYPGAFNPDRPLRLLFLGQVSLRKGVGILFEAMRRLSAEPIELWLVGPAETAIPADLRRSPRIHYVGPVARRDVAEFYRMADLFLFPTLSDGFGLTQLEAQAWRLPIVATRYCGGVVRNGHNGALLSELSATSLEELLRELLRGPERVQRWSANSQLDDRYSMAAVGAALLQCVEA